MLLIEQKNNKCNCKTNKSYGCWFLRCLLCCNNKNCDKGKTCLKAIKSCDCINKTPTFEVGTINIGLSPSVEFESIDDVIKVNYVLPYIDVDFCAKSKTVPYNYPATANIKECLNEEILSGT